MRSLLGRGGRVVVPEIADYEVGRELLRANRIRSLGRLDALKTNLEYLPIATAVMLRAAGSEEGVRGFAEILKVVGMWVGILTARALT